MNKEKIKGMPKTMATPILWKNCWTASFGTIGLMIAYAFSCILIIPAFYSIAFSRLMSTSITYSAIKEVESGEEIDVWSAWKRIGFMALGIITVFFLVGIALLCASLYLFEYKNIQIAYVLQQEENKD